MNYVKISIDRSEFMAASLVRVLLLCTTTSAIIKFGAAQTLNDEFFGQNLVPQYADVGLKFLEEPSDTIVAVGNSAELRCHAQSVFDETVSLEWFHNGKKINDSSRMRKNNRILKVTPKKRTSSSVAGSYECIANITRGLSPAVLISRTALVKIEKLSAISTPNETITSTVGKTIRLECVFTSVPAASVKWKFQNKWLPMSNSSRYDTSVSGVLYISDLKLTDSGEYRCVVSNPSRKKPKISSPFHVNIVSSGSVVNEKNLLSEKSTSVNKISVISGENFTLECFALDGGHRMVQWNFTSARTNQYNVLAEGKYFSILKKTDASLDDAGWYSCVVIRDDLSTHEISKFYVLVGSPPRFTIEPKSQNITLAYRVNFECAADGHPSASIQWLRNGVPVQTDTRVVIQSTKLMLSITNTEDFGIYQCIASNEFGNVSSAARLYMVDIANPSSPVNVSCMTVNSTSVLLRWQQPNDATSHQPPVIFKIGNNGAADMKYVYDIACHKAGGSYEEQFSQPATSNSFVVESLIPNTEYVFSVRSFQGTSGSDPSKNVTCVTFAEKPTTSTIKSMPCSFADCLPYSSFPFLPSTNESILHLELVNDTTVSVSWEMETPTLKIDSSFVQYKKTTDGEWMKTIVDFNQNHVMLTNLEAGKLYEISLIFIWNDTEATVDTKTIMTSHRLHLNVTNESTNSVTIVWNSRSKNVFYTVQYKEKGRDQSFFLPSTFVSIVTISNLKPNTNYVVEVQEHRDNDSFDFDSAFILARTLPVSNNETQSSSTSTDKADHWLSNDQVVGILIGLGIGFILIILCVVTIICCKRHFEKHHHRTLNQSHALSPDDKNEMKIISENSIVPKGTFVNGHGSNVSLPLPLLSSSCGYANGFIQNRNVFYDMESKTLREESDQLLNNSDSPLEDTCLMVPEMNEHDHEGGDSGYCDRNHSQSPHLKDGEEGQRFRKCSDVTMDDGFYELQVISGTISVGCESNH